METHLKVGVMGAGVFAGYHVSKVAAHDRATLIGVFDRNEDKARDVAKRNGGEVFLEAEKLASVCDALIIAVPGSDHASLAKLGLTEGCHLLIEKPMATSVVDCDDIIGLARSKDRILQIGHQERVVMNAIGLQTILDRPTELQITRHSGPSDRNLDTSVVMDLMIHDLDLVLSLFGEPDWVNTEAAKRVYSEDWDEVRAELGYADFTAYPSASRNAEPSRQWTLRYETGTVQIDFGQKTLTHDTAYALNAAFGDDPSVQDSLATAFDQFVKACLDGTPPLATGEEGRAAVRVARMIEGTP
ncbi:MAG: Gfo/Idh/MocA family oxidoreductase [Pseudomonadota bacterium]